MCLAGALVSADVVSMSPREVDVIFVVDVVVSVVVDVVVDAVVDVVDGVVSVVVDVVKMGVDIDSGCRGGGCNDSRCTDVRSNSCCFVSGCIVGCMVCCKVRCMVGCSKKADVLLMLQVSK